MADALPSGWPAITPANIDPAADLLPLFDASGTVLGTIGAGINPLYAGKWVNVRSYGATNDAETASPMVDATTAFDSAIAQLSDGDTLYIPPGSYYIPSVVEIADLNWITVEATGATFYDDAGNNAHVALAFRACTYCTMNGGSFDMGRSKNPASPVPAGGENFTAVAVYGCSDLVFNRLHMKDVKYGIEVSDNTSLSPAVDSARITARFCTAQCPDGIYPYSAAEDPLAPETFLVAKSCQGLEVIGCRMHHMRLVLTNATATSGEPTRGVLIDHNYVEEPVDSSVYLVDTHGALVNCNILLDCGKDTAKAVQGCKDITFTGNYIRNGGQWETNSTHGIQVALMDGAVITGNTIVVTEQNLTEQMRPIGVYASTNIEIGPNTITNRVPTLQTNQKGIVLSPASSFGSADVENINIHGGTITDATDAGIYFLGASGYAFRDITIDGVQICSFDDAGSSPSASAHYTNEGIDMRCVTGVTMERITIRNCRIKGMENHGVQIGGAGTMTDITITENDFTDFEGTADHDIEVSPTASAGGTMTRVKIFNNRHHGKGNLNGPIEFQSAADNRLLQAYNNTTDGIDDQPNVIALTASETQTAADDGLVFSNEGAASIITVDLEAFTVGKKRTFIRNNATYSFRIRADITPSPTVDKYVGEAVDSYIQLDDDGGELHVWCNTDGVVSFRVVGAYTVST